MSKVKASLLALLVVLVLVILGAAPAVGDTPPAPGGLSWSSEAN
jgi:hypothetical protein